MGEVTSPVAQEQMQQWHAVLDSVGEGIWGIDLKGQCTFANPMAVKTFGFDSDKEMVGKNMHALVHHHHPDGRDFPDIECPISAVLLSNTSLRRLRDTMFRKDGSSFVAEISACNPLG